MKAKVEMHMEIKVPSVYIVCARRNSIGIFPLRVFPSDP